VVNILMLSGSLYMLQVYDRVIPSRNIATLIGLSLMVLFAYLVQGYFEALRARMLCRIATLFDVGLQDSIHTALATLPLRGVGPMLLQQSGSYRSECFRPFLELQPARHAAARRCRVLCVSRRRPQAQTYDPHYPACLQVYGIGGGYIACGYASLAVRSVSVRPLGPMHYQS
jgi:hypothetical protein